MEEKQRDSPQLSVREKAKIQAQLGNVKQQIVKLVTGKKGETKTFESEDMGDESFSAKGTVYFKNCEECEYVLNAPSVKVLIEACNKCAFTLNGHIKTEILEVWKSETSLKINTTVKTLQADMCPKLSIQFNKAESLGNIVWAGIQQLSIKFDDSPHNTLETSLEEMKKEVPDLNPEIDQFIVRFIDDKLKQELVVRLENGFPTTEREANDFDEKSKINAEKAEAYVRMLVAESKISIRPKEEVEKEEAEKREEEKEKPGTEAHHEAPKSPESPEAVGGEKKGETEDHLPVEGAVHEDGAHQEEEDRKKVQPEKKISKKPERVYIGVDN